MPNESKNLDIYKALTKKSNVEANTNATDSRTPIENSENIIEAEVPKPTTFLEEMKMVEKGSLDKVHEEFVIDDPSLKELLQDYITKDEPSNQLKLWKMIGKIYGTDEAVWEVVEELFDRFDSMEKRMNNLSDSLSAISNDISKINIVFNDSKYNSPDSLEKRMDNIMELLNSISDKITNMDDVKEERLEYDKHVTVW